jgi:hypothetical protein
MPSKKVASAYVDLQLQTAQFKAAIGEATNTMKQFASQTREEMQKSRESVRLLSESIGLGIPRGLQNIISKMPLVTTAMNTAFDAVVVIALIHTVVEAGEKIVEFAKKSEEAAQKHRDAWRDITTSMQRGNDQGVLLNLKLADANAKLEHKPQQNGMKIALEEAKIAADELGDKLVADITKIETALKAENQAGVMGWLARVTGNAGDTSGVATQAAGFKSRIEDIQGNDALSPEERTRQTGEQANLEYRIAQQRIRDAQGEVDRLDRLHKENDPAGRANDTAARGVLGAWKDYASGIRPMASMVSIAQEHTGLQTQNDKDTANAAQIAAQKLADEKRLKAFEQQLEDENAINKKSVAQTRAFWESKIAAFTAGTDAYDAVMTKYHDASAELSKQFEGIRKGAAPTAAPVTDINKMLVDQGEDATQTGERWKQLNDEVAKGYENYAEFTDKMAELTINIGESTGALTPHAAAIERAAQHAEAYARAIAGLEVELARIDNDKSLTPVQRETQSKGVSNQISSLGYSSQVQQLQDQQAVWSTSFSGAMDSSFNGLIRRSQDFNAQFKDLLTTTVTDINDSILKLLTEKNDPHPFRAAGHDIFMSVAKTGLQDAEGGLLSLFGHGSKPDGTHSNPIYTRDADKMVSGGGAGSGFLGWANDNNFMSSLFGGKLFGRGGLFGGGAIPDGSNEPLVKGLGMGAVHPQQSGIPGLINTIGQLGVKFATAGAGGASDDDSGSGSYADVQNSGNGGGFFNQSGDFISVPGMAGGGLMSPGDWYMTGEQGPELLQVGSTSRINNARDTAAMFAGSGGGDTHHHWNVDARYSHDPAATHAAVQRGIAEAVPHIIAATKASSHDDKRRTPVKH